MTNPWWHPADHADRRPLLLARGRIQGAVRVWLAQEGFTEVDTPALVVSPGNEAHLHAFATTAIGNDGIGRPRYLHTSPEFAMKKLLAAGETRIASFAHVYRNRESGARHLPEFVMLEWYRAGEGYQALMQDVCDLARIAATQAGSAVLRHGAKTCDPFAAPQWLSVAQAFAEFAGIDLSATMDGQGATDAAALGAALQAAGMGRAASGSWSDMFAFVLSEKIEPHLGQGRLTILDHYPAAEAALARRLPGDPRLSERFEVYACGVELANGFGELTDAAEQRRRFEAEMDLKARLYGERYPLDEDFLTALAIMPEAAGIALGFDRLVMLATGAPRIENVVWVPPA